MTCIKITRFTMYVSELTELVRIFYLLFSASFFGWIVLGFLFKESFIVFVSITWKSMLKVWIYFLRLYLPNSTVLLVFIIYIFLICGKYGTCTITSVKIIHWVILWSWLQGQVRLFWICLLEPGFSGLILLRFHFGMESLIVFVNGKNE